MSNREVNIIRKHGLSVKISPTAHNVHQTILYTYDTRLTKANGEPNPGFRKSYPGMNAFLRATGVSRQSVERAISELIAKNIIDQVTLGKPGVRAEYRPIYALQLLGEPVNLALHVSRKNESSKRKKNVAPDMKMSKPSVQNVSNTPSTISTLSINKYEKYKKNENGHINRDRWYFILSHLNNGVRECLEPGLNYEKRLNKLEHQGTTPEAVGKFMAHQNWNTAHNIGGLFEYFLDGLLGVLKGSKSSLMPPHCGNCDPITRQYAESSVGIDGKETFDCPTCSPTQIRLRTRLANSEISKIADLLTLPAESSGSPN